MNKVTALVEDFMMPFPHTIGSEQNLAKAKDMMHQYHCRHLPVKHGGNLVGILSLSDLNLMEGYDDPHNLTVEEVMTTDIYQVLPHTPLRDIAEKMVEFHYSSALVTRKTGELLGIFTWVDLAKAFLALS